MANGILQSQCVAAIIVSLATSTAMPAAAQSVPTIDTEDATLGSADVAMDGRFHPMLAIDLRNGDFARGDYDDDSADLKRPPLHVQLGLAIELSRDPAGEAKSWLLLQSFNGFHAPVATERTAPRGWYETNNLAAIVVTPVRGLRTAAVYTIKASPNGVSATTHEASLSFAYDGNDAAGALVLTFAVTIRPKGDHGIFTLAGIEPSFDLLPRDRGPKLSLPIAAGIGWNGFYGRATGTRKYVSFGIALEQPFMLGA